jgi:NAD(P)-dependent dehydrogenase (short-subunit alcohol dehydrogenase family)
MYTVPDQTGKRFVITGVNAGTDKEAARRIAAAGGAVIMAVRTPSKGEAAKAEILADPPGAALEVRQLDLADRSGVRAFAESLLADGTPVDVLVPSGSRGGPGSWSRCSWPGPRVAGRPCARRRRSGQ